MDFPKRKPLRYPGFDYSTLRYYFVTICTHDKICLFGEVDGLNRWGEIAQAELLRIPDRLAWVSVDCFVVMPNHIHAILIIGSSDPLKSPVGLSSLPTIVGLYKSGVSKQIHRYNPTINVWQKSYFDRIIRNEKEYLGICQYIEENPARWKTDEMYVL